MSAGRIVLTRTCCGPYSTAMLYLRARHFRSLPASLSAPTRTVSKANHGFVYARHIVHRCLAGPVRCCRRVGLFAGGRADVHDGATAVIHHPADGFLARDERPAHVKIKDGIPDKDRAKTVICGGYEGSRQTNGSAIVPHYSATTERGGVSARTSPRSLTPGWSRGPRCRRC